MAQGSCTKQPFVLYFQALTNWHLLLIEQDGQILAQNRLILSTGNSTVLTLQGTTGDNGSYACRLSNSITQSYKYFDVKFTDESQMSIALVSTVSVVVVILIVMLGTGIKLYQDKVISILQKQQIKCAENIIYLFL